MSVTPPPGYGLHARSYQPDTGGAVCVNVIGFSNLTLAPAATCESLVSSAVSTSGRPYNTAAYFTDWNTVQLYTLVNIGGILGSHTTVLSTPGAKSGGAPVNPNVSMVCNKNTAIAGRQYRGRVAKPAGFLDAGTVDEAGIILGSVVTAENALWAAALAAMTTASVPMVLIHGPNKLGVTPTPTVVSSVTLNNITGTQRKRMRRR